MKLCKSCHEEIHDEAVKCKHCKSSQVKYLKSAESILLTVWVVLPLMATLYMLLMMTRLNEFNYIPGCNGELQVVNMTSNTVVEPYKIYVSNMNADETSASIMAVSDKIKSHRMNVFGDIENKSDHSWFEVTITVKGFNANGKVVFVGDSTVDCIPSKTTVPVNIKGPLLETPLEITKFEYVVKKGRQQRVIYYV